MKFTQIFLILMFFKTAYVHTNGVRIDDSSKDKASCEKDWDQFGVHCYKFEGGPLGTSLSWRGASARCSELGGHLASIHSKEENDFLLNSYGIKNGQYVWIGLHAPDDISKYQWDDGSHIDFKNWAINEPNPIKEQQNLYCAVLIDDGLFGEPGEWVDWVCDHYEPFICKKKIQTEYVSERKHPKLILVDHEFSTSTMKTTNPGKTQEENTRSSNRITMKAATTGKNQEESTRSSNRMEIKTPENQGEIASTSNTCRNKNTALLSAFLNMLLYCSYYFDSISRRWTCDS